MKVIKRTIRQDKSGFQQFKAKITKYEKVNCWFDSNLLNFKFNKNNSGMKEPSSVIEYNCYNTDFKPNDLANQKAISAFWKNYKQCLLFCNSNRQSAKLFTASIIPQWMTNWKTVYYTSSNEK